VHQTLDTALDGKFPRLLRVRGCRRVSASSVQVETKLLHLVRMTVLLVAGDAQVEVVADRAVVPRLHRLDAGVAVVHELILALAMKLVEKG
jgi:hypothetical protein